MTHGSVIGPAPSDKARILALRRLISFNATFRRSPLTDHTSDATLAVEHHLEGPADWQAHMDRARPDRDAVLPESGAERGIGVDIDRALSLTK
jgi:hypothetical protein